MLTAESDNLVVVLNDSTEYTAPVYKAELGPTPATETFWKDLTKVYGQDPQVVFDLFNEPRMYYSGMSAALEWKLWLNGGNFLGANYPFGMAGLARYVRSTLHAKNLFWIEGPRFSFSFAGMLRERAALKVSGVVYAVHHPAAPHDASGWYADFGYLSYPGSLRSWTASGRTTSRRRPCRRRSCPPRAGPMRRPRFRRTCRTCPRSASA